MFEADLSATSAGYMVTTKFYKHKFQDASKEASQILNQLKERTGLPVIKVGPNPDRVAMADKKALIWWAVFRVSCDHRVDTRETLEKVIEENMYLLNDIEWSDSWD